MYCMSGNGNVLLDWISADADIISFVLQPLPGVNNQCSVCHAVFMNILIKLLSKHMIVPHDISYKLL